MRTTVLAYFFVTLMFTVFCPSLNAQSLESKNISFRTTDRLPGVDLAEGISTVTGMAISPLLGTSVIGMYKYLNAAPEVRNELPWFCHPAVWGFCICLLAMCFLKDSFGTVTPAVVKKPLDMAELFESKLSALIVGIGVVPFITSQIAQNVLAGNYQISPGQQEIMYLNASFIPAELLTNNYFLGIITIPIFVLAFLVVWLFAHAINVIIALSPFGLLDAGLKLFRLALIISIFVSFKINPWLGTGFSLVIIIVAVIVAGWSFRLTVYGAICATDLFFPFVFRKDINPGAPHGFLAKRVSGVPVRTFGKLSMTSNRICFCYKPWLLLKSRIIELPDGQYRLSRGVLYPSLLGKVAEDKHQTIFNFPPRYRGLEDSIGVQMGICEIEDGTLLCGFKRIRAWLREFVAFTKVDCGFG